MRREIREERFVSTDKDITIRETRKPKPKPKTPVKPTTTPKTTKTRRR